MKIWPILEQDIQNQLDEGWKENVIATIMSVATLFGGVWLCSKMLTKIL